jgi:hypothetical protein
LPRNRFVSDRPVRFEDAELIVAALVLAGLAIVAAVVLRFAHLAT